MGNFETLLYEEANGVAWVTLNRPEVHNAFNVQMTKELKEVWRALRHNRDVNCAVLTAAGEKAFCTGIDRNEVNVDWADDLAAGRDATGGIAAGLDDLPLFASAAEPEHGPDPLAEHGHLGRAGEADPGRYEQR